MNRSASIGRHLSQLALALGLILGVVVTSATAASAHAVVVSSQPADGERLPTAPTSVTLQFNEPVKADLGGLQVVDSHGNRVDTGTDRVTGDSLTTSLKSDLPDGTYVASYRVTSADSHPVKGAIVFGIGDAPASGIDVGSITTGGADHTFDLLGWASRLLAYLGALTAAGLAFFLVFVHDGGPDARPMARIVRGGVLVGALGAIGATATQAALATGRGWQAVFDTSVIHQVLVDSLDWANIVLLVGLVGLLLSLEARSRGARQGLAFYGGLATTVSFVLSGHSTAAESRWIAILSNAVHVTCAALWLGGLVGLTIVLVSRTRRRAEPDEPEGGPGRATTPAAPVAVGTTLMVTERPIEVADVERLRGTALIVGRFSTLALVTVVALWIAGGALAWIEVGSIGAFTSTTYGRLVLVKLAIAGVIGAVAAYNRIRLVPDIMADVDLATDLVDPDTAPPATLDSTAEAEADVITAQPDRWAFDGLRKLARTVVFEALAIVVVLGVTSALVNTTPGRNASGEVGVVNQTLPIPTSTAGSTLNLVVAPARSGTNALHLSYADPRGKPIAIQGPVQIELSLPSAEIGPISRDPLPAGPGHYILNDADLSPGGDWTITVVTRTGEFDQQRTEFSVKIR